MTPIKSFFRLYPYTDVIWQIIVSRLQQASSTRLWSERRYYLVATQSQYAAAARVPLIKSPAVRVPLQVRRHSHLHHHPSLDSHVPLFQVVLPPDIHPLPDSVTPYVSPSQPESSNANTPPFFWPVRLSVRARTTRPHPRIITANHARHLRSTTRGTPSVPRGRKRTATTGSAQTGRSRIRRQRNPARARASGSLLSVRRETIVWAGTDGGCPGTGFGE